MKKIILLFIFILSIYSCTENIRTKTFGGNMTIELPKGKKLIEATWKDNNLFYLIEDMDENYKPKNKMFIENSSYGILESKVIFIETK